MCHHEHKECFWYFIDRTICRVMLLIFTVWLKPYRHNMHVGGCRGMPFYGFINSVSTYQVSLYSIVNEGAIGVN